ncbi:hypothetical protein COV16_06200 [Candidatus Woesearchaeota archaeon CG10_big_fil_rev_8_21_14_0_10_34_8]|nr:MAG: hypothetical protein COV16_06200 [Candidatus Woesearchaeota archaeon CG10_big_fil_rev_8_21_14_0_10_34_8]
MPKKDLIDYVKRQLDNGHDAHVIREHLVNHGHSPKIADEVLKSLGYDPKHINSSPFSGKAIAFVVIGLLVLSSLGFGGYMMFTSSDDLAGAATDATQAPVKTAEEKKVIEQPPHEEVKEVVNEEIKEEETKEEQIITEEPKTESVLGKCSNDIDCATDETCYKSSCQTDSDKDGLPDNEEKTHGTEIYDQDSDGDGISDLDEVNSGTDPLDSEDPGYASCFYDYDCATDEACTATGVCVACEDSDESNYKKQGITKGVYYTSRLFTVAQDGCTVEGNLLEYHCRSDDYIYYEEISCEDAVDIGYTCDMGRCVQI